MIVANKDKLQSHRAAIDILVDILNLLASLDANAIVAEVVLPMSEPPFSPDSLMSSVFSFIRIYDRVQEGDDGKVRDTLQVSDIGKLLGASLSVSEDFDFLKQQRKEFMAVNQNSPIQLMNSVLMIGKFNRSICSAYEIYDSQVGHNLSYLPAPSKGSVDTIPFYALSSAVIASRITIPLHIPKETWLAMLSRYTIHVHSRLRAESLATLKHIIRSFPDCRVVAVHQMIKLASEMPYNGSEEVESLLNNACELMRIWKTEHENGNTNVKKGLLAGETNVESTVELTSKYFDGVLIPILCHSSIGARTAALKTMRLAWKLDTAVSGGESTWIMKFVDQGTLASDILRKASEDRALEGWLQVQDNRHMDWTIDEVITITAEDRLWGRVVGELLNAVSDDCADALNMAVSTLYKNCTTLQPVVEAMKGKGATPEEKNLSILWCNSMCALMSCCPDDDGSEVSAEETGESTVVNNKQVVDLLWTNLLSENKIVRLYVETAATFLGKKSFMRVVKDLTEFMDNFALVGRRFGKKHVENQLLTFVITFIWRTITNNMYGRKVLFASAFKMIREKVLIHLKLFTMSDSLLIAPNDNPILANRIRYNVCCWIKNVANEVNNVAKVSIIEFDTQKIFGEDLHEQCFKVSFQKRKAKLILRLYVISIFPPLSTVG